jgi:hypothetical protein
MHSHTYKKKKEKKHKEEKKCLVPASYTSGTNLAARRRAVSGTLVPAGISGWH